MLAPEWLLTWESQVVQYPLLGLPGISYFKGETGPDTWVDCLLWRDDNGYVIGILNHYCFDSLWEKRGNVNIWIHPQHQREGIGTALVNEANDRWGPFPVEQWSFTPAGLALARKMGLIQ